MKIGLHLVCILKKNRMYSVCITDFTLAVSSLPFVARVPSSHQSVRHLLYEMGVQDLLLLFSFHVHLTDQYCDVKFDM